MVVIAIVATIVAIAVPSYQEQVRKSHRARAKADLVEYAQLAERFFTVNNTYAGFALPSTQSPREAGATARYRIAAATTATTFTLTATALNRQANDRCGNLSITNTGNKTSTGTSPLGDCW
ncbi:pilus assembly protein PilE [Pseudoxanthomonas sp. NC8]|nr:pilus assembly protein PilE [Pseudoxanthomonas sp. NC8]